MFSERFRRLTQEAHAAAGPLPSAAELRQKGRRQAYVRRSVLAAAGVMLTMGAASGLDLALRADRVDHTAATAREASPSARRQDAEWTLGPRAGWLRRAVDRTAFDVVGTTGSALTIHAYDEPFYLWATAAGTAAAAQLRREGYRLRRSPAVADAYSDGVRTVWITRGQVVWLESASTGRSAPPAGVVERLVQATAATPFAVP